MDEKQQQQQQQQQQPFRFLDLPLELQRLIFQTCYAEPWTVTGKLPSPRENIIEVVFNSPFSSLPQVSKHFSHEAKRAIALSHSGCYHGAIPNKRTGLAYAPRPASFDLGLAHAELKMRQLPHLRTFRQRFPNVMQIHVSSEMNSVLHRTQTMLVQYVLLDVLAGNCDDEVAATALRDFQGFMALCAPGPMVPGARVVLPPLAERLCGVKTIGCLALPATAFRAPEGVYRYVKGQNLYVEFEFGDAGCRVLRKWFEAGSGAVAVSVESVVHRLEESVRNSRGRHVNLSQDYFENSPAFYQVL